MILFVFTISWWSWVLLSERIASKHFFLAGRQHDLSFSTRHIWWNMAETCELFGFSIPNSVPVISLNQSAINKHTHFTQPAPYMGKDRHLAIQDSTSRKRTRPRTRHHEDVGSVTWPSFSETEKSWRAEMCTRLRLGQKPATSEKWQSGISWIPSVYVQISTQCIYIHMIVMCDIYRCILKLQCRVGYAYAQYMFTINDKCYIAKYEITIIIDVPYKNKTCHIS